MPAGRVRRGRHPHPGLLGRYLRCIRGADRRDFAHHLRYLPRVHQSQRDRKGTHSLLAHLHGPLRHLHGCSGIGAEQLRHHSGLPVPAHGHHRGARRHPHRIHPDLEPAERNCGHLISRVGIHLRFDNLAGHCPWTVRNRRYCKKSASVMVSILYNPSTVLSL